MELCAFLKRKFVHTGLADFIPIIICAYVMALFCFLFCFCWCLSLSVSNILVLSTKALGMGKRFSSSFIFTSFSRRVFLPSCMMNFEREKERGALYGGGGQHVM
jgi:hypothetical protein